MFGEGKQERAERDVRGLGREEVKRRKGSGNAERMSERRAGGGGGGGVGKGGGGGGGGDFGPLFKTFPWKSLTKNKGKAHIYQDVLVMGSMYVIKYRILIEILDFGRKVRFTVKDPEY